MAPEEKSTGDAGQRPAPGWSDSSVGDEDRDKR